MICEALCEIRLKNNSEIHKIPPGKCFDTSDITTVLSLVHGGKVKILTNNIFTAAKQSPQCPQCPPTQYCQGFHDADIEISKSAMSAEAGADRTRENPALTRNINTWEGEMKEVVDWFLTLTPPREPFYLQDHMRVIDPVKFFESLRREVKAGPAGIRAKLGTLQSDLRALYAKFRSGGMDASPPENNLSFLKEEI